MNSKIYPCLWFDNNAKEAAQFYCSVFENTSIKSESNIVVTITSSNQDFMCLNGGPVFNLNPSISFYAICETEKEVDKLWNDLKSQGSVLMELDKYPWSSKYGWVKDRFGVSWQLATGKISDLGQKFTPSLLFTGKQNGNARKAIDFYTSLFSNSEIQTINQYDRGEGDVEGNLKYGQFSLSGYSFIAMDSSLDHKFAFNEAISIVVECDSQDEIDYFWNRFTEKGEESQCGWLKDQFGVSWQIIPSVLKELMSDPARSERVISAFLKMRKFDREALIRA